VIDAIRKLTGRPPAAPRRPRVCIVRQCDLYVMADQRECEALAGAGFDVEFLCMRSDERPRRTVVNGVTITSLPASLERSGAIGYAIGYGRFFLLTASVLTARHLRRRYSVIQINTMPDFLVFAAIVPKLLGSRVVAYMKEPTPELAEVIYGPGRLSKALARIEQWTLRFADHSVTVTDQLKQRYVERGARADRISVVRKGTGAETLISSWTPPEETAAQGFTLICHGSIEDRYGQDVIVDAVKLLHDELPDLRVVFTGRGSNVDQLVAMIDEAGLGEVVSYEGWVSRDRLNDLLHSADAGIVAQKASPYSHLVHTNKMVDYWIFGLPVIASRLRAVSEVYDSSELEYYEPDDPRDLARAIRRLHDDPARRAELATNGAQAQLRNGWAVQRGIYVAVYDALLERGERDDSARQPVESV
jgi:glycosyltransferase involved in cell wall biosynthesis